MAKRQPRKPRPPKAAAPSALAVRHQRFRKVVFRSGRLRIFWGVIGVALVVGGYLLAKPAFERVQDAPDPWALWVSTNAGQKSIKRDPSWLLTLNIEAGDGCGNPVRATGHMEFGDESRQMFERRPTFLTLGATRRACMRRS